MCDSADLSGKCGYVGNNRPFAEGSPDVVSGMVYCNTARMLNRLTDSGLSGCERYWG